MHIVIAPDSFKGSLSALAVAEAIERGVRAVFPDAEVHKVPIADGGEGTVEALVAATRGRIERRTVRGPLGEPVQAHWGVLGDGSTAVIEMAAASGLPLVPKERRDPRITTTYGTGELIRAVLDAGLTRLIIGIGGSATNDGGCGAAQALGATFFDDGGLIHPPITGGLLASVRRIDLASLDPRLSRVALSVACDVTNPLTGPDGAAHVYSPQKGARPADVAALDEGLRSVAAVWRTQLGADVEALPGAGAAGGFGGGAVAMLGAKLRRGIELVLEAVGFDDKLRGCDLVLTGEGRLDGQTLRGKTIAGVAAAAQRHRVPVVALVGSVGEGWQRHREMGVERVIVIGEGLPREESMRRAGELLERAGAVAVG